MKEEWKPEELRATSEEIRGAVMPKSITPEMVGGTLLGVVNALGEVVDVLGEIPREHVRIKVRGYDGTAGVSGAGATVWLDIFHSKSYPVVSLPRQELTCNDEGVVEFDVPHGYRYAVFSQICGLGASFQMVTVAATAMREIKLWNLPIGVKYLYRSEIDNYANSAARMVPVVAERYISDYDVTGGTENGVQWGWDAEPDKDEHFNYCIYCGILVSTADTSFVIGINSKSEGEIRWSSNSDYGAPIPGIPAINHHTDDGKYAGEYKEAQNRARADMDGNMNTSKILDSAHNPTAARFCADYIPASVNEQRWLPSAGQVTLMHLNRGAINALMQEYRDMESDEYDLLPDNSADSPNQWTLNENLWTSTIFDEYSSWLLSYKCTLNFGGRNLRRSVRAVSCFQFEID